ncbi:hypothetical protein [Nocardioides campestrisoli]|uniref:hypothetical protein n=1 Tax=Nocardioides campestrisoli TaxID=2736757 RepID=UPI00163DBBFA|nr:hypothetical protein [Nocardioides campestrisoli]
MGDKSTRALRAARAGRWVGLAGLVYGVVWAVACFATGDVADGWLALAWALCMLALFLTTRKVTNDAETPTGPGSSPWT